MLKDVLRIIYDKRMYSRSLIASELNISQAMVEDLVNKLLDRGYLMEEKASSCGHSCSSCPYSKCSETGLKTYVLTDKGLGVIGA